MAEETYPSSDISQPSRVAYTNIGTLLVRDEGDHFEVRLSHDKEKDKDATYERATYTLADDSISCFKGKYLSDGTEEDPVDEIPQELKDANAFTIVLVQSLYARRDRNERARNAETLRTFFTKPQYAMDSLSPNFNPEYLPKHIGITHPHSPTSKPKENL